MDIVLVPGLWLDGDSWAEVAEHLTAAGHRPHPLTLPNGPGVRLADQVAAVVQVVDDVGEGESVMLVGHSASCGVVHGAVDARPMRVARAVHVAGFPTGDGLPVAGPFPTEDGAVLLPGWDAFDDADLTDLDDDTRVAFRAAAVPSPAYLTTDRQVLHDPRRYEIPVTAVCSEYTSAQLRRWIEDGEDPVQELARIRDVDYVDLPTGHWPQLTRPGELADVVLAGVSA